MARDRRRKIALASALLLRAAQIQFTISALCELDGDSTGFRHWADEDAELQTQLLLLVLGSPLFRDLLPRTRRARRFWAAPRGQGVWETQFLGTFCRVGEHFPDWENDQYITHLRMTKDAFWRLHRKYGYHFEHQVTQFRLPVPSDKRLAMTLQFLSHGLSYSQLALLYSVGHTTSVHIVHHTVDVLYHFLVPNCIQFPRGGELERVIEDFEHLSGGGLPQCAGAVDGTFVKVRKPSLYGDSYWCYKTYTAILLLACVDARGVFTYVNGGSPGSTGDAAVFNYSRLSRKIKNRHWLGTHSKVINNMEVKPYLVGDSAFALTSYMMKCYNEGEDAPHQVTFNHRQIRTRRVVEQAFGRLKGRYHVLVDNNIYNPDFATRLAIVCCALHNVCERWSCEYDDSWEVNKELYQIYHPAPDAENNDEAEGPGLVLRDHLAAYLQELMPAPLPAVQ